MQYLTGNTTQTSKLKMSIQGDNKYIFSLNQKIRMSDI